MKIETSSLKKKNTYREGLAIDLGSEISAQSSFWVKRFKNNLVSMSPDGIKKRLGGGPFFVSHKVDGELAVILFDGKNCAAVNSGGTARADIACISEMASCLAAARVKSAILGCELFVPDEKRERVTRVQSALGSKGKPDELKLCVFDIAELDGNAMDDSYSVRFKKIQELVGKRDKVVFPDTTEAPDAAAVEKTFLEFTSRGREGVVVRDAAGSAFKIKPELTIDAVVLGYSSEDDAIVEILVGIMRSEKQIQSIGRTGTGFSEKDKKDLYKTLSKLQTTGNYIFPDTNRVAMVMTRPQVVAQIRCNELLTENSKGGIKNPVMNFDGKSYSFAGFAAGVSVIHPVFESVRDDKNADVDSVGLRQLTQAVELEEGEVSPADYRPSEILFREVYEKQSKGSPMVMKFLAWKTNKNDVDESFPGFVFHYTNFSAGRKDMLEREIRVSDSEKQIMQICRLYIEENVKSGWKKVGQGAPPAAAEPKAAKKEAKAPAEPKAKAKAPKKEAAKKPAAKKAKK